MKTFSIRCIEDLRTHRSHLENLRKLYLHSFPLSERRSIIGFLRLLSEASHHVELILAFTDEEGDSTLVGFALLHHLSERTYVEYLCTSPAYRGKGLGSLFLSHLLELFPRMILEVEPLGTDQWSHRRISFYERRGFEIIDAPYLQPPYRKGGREIPLLLMSTAPVADPRVIIRELHQRIYGQSVD